jgi:hypothetical protein
MVGGILFRGKMTYGFGGNISGKDVVKVGINLT